MQKTVPRRRGTLEARTMADGRVVYAGRLRLRDGTKSPRMSAPTGMTQVQAAAWLAGLQAAEDADGAVYLAKVERARELAAGRGEACEGETCSSWFARFLASPERAGVPYENKEAALRWRKWIAPHLDGAPIATVGREDVERVRDALDDAIRSGVIRPKTAQNVWTVLTTAFKAARNAKDRGLRARDDNPCTDVLPPDDGPGRAKHWLYPREAEALFACEAVPLEWRRTFAVALYTGLRPEELAELRWSDVDFAAGEIHVTRAWSMRGERVELPKTQAGVRRLPIEPHVAPVLRVMGQGRAPHELVAPLVKGTGRHDLAPRFRAALQATGACRPEVFASTRTHVLIGFRACRDTYATWSALAGRPIATVASRLGHESLETTRGYYREVEDRPGLQGAPFPPLGALLGPPSGPDLPQVAETIVEAPGIEPTPPAPVHEDSSTCHEWAPQTPPEPTALEGTSAQASAHPDAALARALELAAVAGQWAIVAQLARELEARRLEAEPNVVSLRRGRP